MRKWRDTERCRAAERHAKAAAAPSTVGIYKRPVEGRKGGVGGRTEGERGETAGEGGDGASYPRD